MVFKSDAKILNYINRNRKMALSDNYHHMACKYTIRIKTSAQLSTRDDSCHSIAGQSCMFIKIYRLKMTQMYRFITHLRFTFLKGTNIRNH